MKKILISVICLLLCLSLFACTPLPTDEEGTEENKTSISEKEEPEKGTGEITSTFSEENKDPTEAATVINPENSRTVIGKGSIFFLLDVVTEDSTLMYEIHTDSTCLGDALIESGLVEGEEGPYGLYIKRVCGISAVFEEDNAYWGLNVNGESAATGADGITLLGGDTIELVYTPA